MWSKKDLQNLGKQLTEQFLSLVQEGRKQAALNKLQAAMRAGCSPQTMSYVDNGSRGVSLPMAAQMALGIGRRPSRVMKEAEERLGLTDDLNNPETGGS